MLDGCAHKSATPLEYLQNVGRVIDVRGYNVRGGGSNG